MLDQTKDQPDNLENLPNLNGAFILNFNIILALGIFSVAGSWLYGLPGLCAGIVSLVFSNKVIRLNKELGDSTESKKIKKIKSARIFAIAGIILSCLYLLGLLLKLLFYKTV